MGWYAKERALDRIRAAAAEGLDLVSFWEEAAAAIRPAVAHHLAPCWFTLDPASLLATSHYDHGMIPELPAGWFATEYYDEDPHKLSGAARSASGVSTVHEVCDGDPTRSRRWMQYVQPYGGDQELFLALRAETRHTWGVLALYREAGQPAFDRDERELLRIAAPHLAYGARRSLLVAAASEPDLADGPGLLVLDTDWEVESLTPGLERWLDDLPGGAWSERGKLPPSVLAVAGHALRTSLEGHPGEVASARVRSGRGQWLVLHGATMIAGGAKRVAVIVEMAHPAHISSLLMSAHGLTGRESDVTQLVLRGESTTAIARALTISPHTVQHHLKSIFEKTGVHSRRDLVGSVFFTHYEPRLRDNERRAADGRPLRGGPVATSVSPAGD